MKLKLMCIVLIVILLVFTSCGNGSSGKIMENTMTIKRNGQMDLTLVDVLDKEYYDWAELMTMAESEVEAYSTGDVSLRDSHMSMDGSNQVMLQYRFDQASTCEDFMNELCFLGTVKEALERKLITNVVLRPYDGGEVISQADLLQMGGNKVLITEINARVETPWEVAYFTEGVLVEEKDVFNTTNAEGISVIVFE